MTSGFPLLRLELPAPCSSEHFWIIAPKLSGYLQESWLCPGAIPGEHGSAMKTVPSGQLLKRTLAGFLIRSLLFLQLFFLPVMAQAQFTHTSSGGVVTITGYSGSGGVVTVPPTINGLPVVAIGSYAFLNNASITSVALPGSITNID
jgi:hypothetical protein